MEEAREVIEAQFVLHLKAYLNASAALIGGRSLPMIDEPYVKLINVNGGPEKRGLAIKSTHVPSLTPIMEFNNLVTVSSKDLCHSYKDCREKLHGDNPYMELQREVQRGNSSSRSSSNSGMNGFGFLPKIFEYERVILLGLYENRDIESKVNWYSPSSSMEFMNSGLFRLIIRLFLRCTVDINFRRKTTVLTSHMDLIDSDDEVHIMLESYANQIVYAIYLMDKLNMITNRLKALREEIYFYGCVCLVNFSSQLSLIKDTIGQCLLPSFSLINHRCIPNTIVYPSDDGSVSRLITIEGIQQSQKGTSGEIYTNYCFTSIPRDLRQMELSSRFYFHCKCRLCCQPHDIFFSYNCTKCGSLICSMDATNCFKSIDEFNYKGSKEKCKSCGTSIDLDKLAFNNKLHRMLLATLFLSEPALSVEYNIVEFEDIAQNIIEGVQEVYSTEGIVKVLLMKSRGFSVGSPNSGLIRNIVNILIRDKVVPGYCFPVSNFINQLDSEDFITVLPTAPAFELDFQNRAIELQLGLQRAFLVNFPCEIKDSRLIANNTFRELAGFLEQLLESMKGINKEDQQYIPLMISDWVEDYDEILHILVACCVFFYFQAFQTYCKYSRRVSHDIKTHLLYLKIISRTLKKKFPWTPRNFKEETFRASLMKLFEFGKVDHLVYQKRGTFKIDYSDRRRQDVFIPIAEMPVLRLALFQ
ncbi:uncharacterized protein RJT20DRAFT_44676 [Scheffersomyces xylosifermentans]|uniref:uncharacterized protein n=1 Tax=Scheffersomyces xylosifermentans TaxID=1304137 RepID=UPI00315D8FB8